jgi:hypothetical protein
MEGGLELQWAGYGLLKHRREEATELDFNMEDTDFEDIELEGCRMQDAGWRWEYGL